MPQLEFDQNQYSKFIKNIGGNNYMMVAGRLQLALRSNQLVNVLTAKLYEDENFVEVVATIHVFNEELASKFKELEIPFTASDVVNTFQGHAVSDKRAVDRNGNPTPEGTRPLEVAETSAVGRALGFAGFGPLESIASAEEMITVLSNERNGGAAARTVPPISEKQEAAIKRRLGVAAEQEAVTRFGKELNQLTIKEASTWMDEIMNSKGKPTAATAHDHSQDVPF